MKKIAREYWLTGLLLLGVYVGVALNRPTISWTAPTSPASPVATKTPQPTHSATPLPKPKTSVTWQTRWQALARWTENQGDQALITRGLLDPHPIVRREAVSLCHRLGRRAGSFVPMLRLALFDRDRAVGQLAAQALGRLLPHHPQAQPALLQAFRYGPNDLKITIAHIWQQAGPLAVVCDSGSSLHASETRPSLQNQERIPRTPQSPHPNPSSPRTPRASLQNPKPQRRSPPRTPFPQIIP